MSVERVTKDQIVRALEKEVMWPSMRADYDSAVASIPLDKAEFSLQDIDELFHRAGENLDDEGRAVMWIDPESFMRKAMLG